MDASRAFTYPAILTRKSFLTLFNNIPRQTFLSSFLGYAFGFLSFFLAGFTASVLFFQQNILNSLNTFTFLLHRHILAQFSAVIPSHLPHVAHMTLPSFQSSPESDFPVNTYYLCTRQGCSFTSTVTLLQSSVPFL